MSKVYRKIALALAVISIISLAGCKDENQDPLLSESKESLVSMIHSNEETIISLNDKITELDQLLKGIQGEKVETSGIEEMDDGTGRLTFVSVDGLIKFPVEFNYPGATQATNESTRVNINETFSFKPTSNWLVKVDGASVTLYHESGISGKITAGKRDKQVQKTTLEDVKTYMNESFFSELPPEQIQYSSLFIDGTEFGWDAQSHTFIDSKDARLRCGLLGYSDQSLQYFFVYGGEQDSAKDEVIISLLNTVSAWNKAISIK